MKTVINLATGTTEQLELTQADLDQRAIDKVAYDAELAELALTKYQRDRAEAYPSLADQADMQYHDAIDGTTTWKDAIAAVKAEFPKPE